LREAAHGLVPSSIIGRRKAGFPTPVTEWMRRELRSWLGDHLEARALAESGILRVDVLRRLFRDHVSGRANYGKALWTAAALSAWLQTEAERSRPSCP
jgi:asparagine synthase (glutamine-hydrolysing)